MIDNKTLRSYILTEIKCIDNDIADLRYNLIPAHTGEEGWLDDVAEMTIDIRSDTIWGYNYFKEYLLDQLDARMSHCATTVQELSPLVFNRDKPWICLLKFKITCERRRI